MKRFALAPLATLMAGPALAHGGAHMHPHGYESILAAIAVIGVAAAVVLYARR